MFPTDLAAAPPVWLLDVDGPINASRAGWSAAPHHATVHAPGPYKLHWSPALLDRIRHIHATGQAEIWWATTWCPFADLLENLWRLPRFPRALPDQVCFLGGALCRAAKADAALAVINAGRRLIWTDDECATPESGVLDEQIFDGQALLIAPSPSRGLRPAHLDAIEEFCGPGLGRPVVTDGWESREIGLWTGQALTCG